MALLRGIETTALGRTRTVEVDYERGGKYVDRSGKPVAVLDMICYGCSNAYFVLEDDPIDFCPHCGRRERTPWASYDEARAWATPYEWKWLRKLSLLPYGLRRFDGAWVLGFAKDSRSLFDTGKYAEVRCLLPGME